MSMENAERRSEMELVKIDLFEGNPGAITFAAEAYEKWPYAAEMAFQRMRDNGIRGDKLYMIWNDCCGRNTEKALRIMSEHSIEDIVEHINYENGYGILYGDEK